MLVCTYDLLPLQATLCLRHFVDFVYQATAKEHTSVTLRNMQESLQLLNHYSPLFQAHSKVSTSLKNIHPSMHAKYAAITSSAD